MGDTLGSATRCAFRFLLFAIALVSAGCSDPSEVSRQVAWSIVGEWLIADTHSHTTFTDGALSVPELVERAIAGGCDVLAITDHSDLSEDAATPEYFEAMRAARVRTPWLILFGGLEWNIPPYGGREHVNLLIDPAQEEQVLTELVDYTLSHFAFEESLMEDAGYGFINGHKRVHQLFVKRVSDFMQRFKLGEDITEELLTVLKAWLINHIKSDDNDYVDIVRKNLGNMDERKGDGWLTKSVKKFFG